MFLVLLKPLLKTRLFVALFVFIALALMTILVCSCVSSGLRHIPLVFSDSSNSTVRVGYLGICINSQCTATSLDTLNSTNLTTPVMASPAISFRDHAIRPYFALICIFSTLCSYIVGLMAWCAQGKLNLHPVAFILLLLSWVSCVIAAVWQEVAVHSATVFLGLSKGNQASGMIWGSVALLTMALVLQAFRRERVDSEIADTPEKAQCRSRYPRDHKTHLTV